MTGRLRLHAGVLLVDLDDFDDPSDLTTVQALVDPKLLLLPGGGELGQRRCPPPHYYIVSDFAGERYPAREVLLPLLSAYCYVKGRAPQILD
jgi:hypothetical protein